MTSNAGGKEINNFTNKTGLNPNSEEYLPQLKELLTKDFSAAFLGRTELIAYSPLTKEIGQKITEIHMERIKARIKNQYNAEFSWTENFTEFVAAKNLDPLSGGRALEGILNKELLPKLAEKCINKILEGSTLKEIDVGVTNNEITLKIV